MPQLQRDECAGVALQLTMGFFFRRSIKFGPFRLNFSKSGVGASVGVRGFRTGISATGRRTTRVTIPGTGIGYQYTHQNAEQDQDRQGRPHPATPSAAPSRGGVIGVVLVLFVIFLVILAVSA